MKTLLSVAAIAASLLSAAPATATVLDFESVVTEGSEFIPDGYGDLNWDNFAIINRNAQPGTGYETGAVSGDYSAYNSWGNPASITAATDTFSFEGAWFTSAWFNNNTLFIEGFTDGDAVADYSVTLTLNTLTPQFLDVSWTGLQRLSFRTSNSQLVMDDLRISKSSPAEVPEPLTIGLLGMGLLGVAGARRRKG
ncbi:PEP-CTERM sorting domain-containing protein [Pedomonas mirosovicensis]|uniref:PEP-CTERM sorting domain-containing protein n=1 Tax=Pedomonas mirosovicensis TaxID=2908641 RepID=UPI0021690D11|nr:PEP-CTERM sorting domain-containing protein [Pedomonas mirosovicensis]MCH8685677.1 PEP-CTERM sorting domain-containing protein [Pedomonas mirosovicensis]